jgi:hypothetical protein
MDVLMVLTLLIYAGTLVGLGIALAVSGIRCERRAEAINNDPDSDDYRVCI